MKTCHRWDSRALHRCVQHSETALALSVMLQRDLVNDAPQCSNRCDKVGFVRTCSWILGVSGLQSQPHWRGQVTNKAVMMEGSSRVLYCNPTVHMKVKDYQTNSVRYWHKNSAADAAAKHTMTSEDHLTDVKNNNNNAKTFNLCTMVKSCYCWHWFF